MSLTVSRKKTYVVGATLDSDGERYKKWSDMISKSTKHLWIKFKLKPFLKGASSHSRREEETRKTKVVSAVGTNSLEDDGNLVPAAHLPQCQTLSWRACGHWSSGPCGSGSSAEWCSSLSRGPGHTRQEHDTSRWNAKPTLKALRGTVAPDAWGSVHPAGVTPKQLQALKAKMLFRMISALHLPMGIRPEAQPSEGKHSVGLKRYWLKQVVNSYCLASISASMLACLGRSWIWGWGAFVPRSIKWG